MSQRTPARPHSRRLSRPSRGVPCIPRSRAPSAWRRRPDRGCAPRSRACRFRRPCSDARRPGRPGGNRRVSSTARPGRRTSPGDGTTGAVPPGTGPRRCTSYRSHCTAACVRSRVPPSACRVTRARCRSRNRIPAPWPRRSRSAGRPRYPARRKQPSSSAPPSSPAPSRTAPHKGRGRSHSPSKGTC